MHKPIKASNYKRCVFNVFSYCLINLQRGRYRTEESPAESQTWDYLFSAKINE